MRPYFGWQSKEVIKKTFAKTTQYGRIPQGTWLKKHYKSPNPALNVRRREEPVATDTVFSDTPAVDGGETCAQVFVGTQSRVGDVYGMKTEKQFVNTLEDNIIDRGAPSKLISDRAQVEISNKVQDILRTLWISSWQSEPHRQWQNPCERFIQTLKQFTNRVMDRTGTPDYLWLACLKYCCMLLNHTATASLNWEVPLTVLTGSTPDISPFRRFFWYEPVYFAEDDTCFPSNSRERSGRWCGICPHVGHAMPYIVLTDDTKKFIYRSSLRYALKPHERNLRMDLLNGEEPIKKEYVKTRHDTSDGEFKEPPSPIIDPSDLVGRTYLKDLPDGTRQRAKIVEAIVEREEDLVQYPDRIKFLCKTSDAEELISYNQLLDHLNANVDEDATVWKFKRITGHQGPLKPSDPEYKGSQYNVMIEWESGEITYEPLAIIAADDPVTCAIYAKEHGLLETPGWKQFKKLARREGKFIRLVKQAKLKSFRTAPRYKYGFEVPRDYKHAMELDKLNQNTKWADAIALEMLMIQEYQVFKDLGHNVAIPHGYRAIRVRLVFDVKHDGRHKARLVTGGHLTPVPLDSIYSGVVSLRSIRIVTFLAELNGMEVWATDIGNAYLEAETSEKVVIRAGPEFGELEGHILMFHKAL